MMERYKERLEVTNDDEWKIISDRIEKVMTAQRETRIGGFGFGGPGGRRGSDTAQADAGNNGGRRNRVECSAASQTRCRSSPKRRSTRRLPPMNFESEDGEAA